MATREIEPPDAPEESSTLTVMMAEYASLRSEIMYFIDVREKLATTIVIILLAQVVTISSEVANLDGMSALLLMGLIFPTLVCILMFRSLDYTLKILQAASYIERDLRPRLYDLVRADIFRWERFKGEMTAGKGVSSKILDYSKWWLYVAAIGISWVFGVFYFFAADGGHEYSVWSLVVIAVSFSLVAVTAIFVLRQQRRFNEYTGASIANADDVTF